MARKADILAAIDRLAGAERAFVRREFLAPALRGGGGVTVRIDGVRLRMEVRPAGFEGWGVFRAESMGRCAVVRAASSGERRRYLALFPAVRVILCHREGARWLALPAAEADCRFGDAGAIRVQLAEDGELFDTVVGRFDGARVWFDEVDVRADPAAAVFLRECLVAMRPPEKVERPGLTAGQCAAYRAVHRYRVAAARADARADAELLLREALSHAGGALRDFSQQRGGGFRVTYEVDGRRHVSFVREDLTVESAGICLSGRDRHFDLASLVGVLREGRGAGRIW